MTTDSERREVASNIMENYVCGGLGYKMASAYNIAMAIGMNPGLLVGDIELWERLADLIEPSARCPHYMHPCCRTDAGGDYIDRDALLELADEMERMPQCELCPAEIVDCSAHPDGCPDALLDHYARRIREACGATS